MNFTFEGKFYIFTSPLDQSLNPSKPYQDFIKRKFDLVLVENGCFIEPNYVIIEGISDSINESSIRNDYKILKDYVTIQKFKPFGKE